MVKIIPVYEEKWAVFQRVRDQIGERIKHFAETGE